jgi:dTDP-4-dehydrorhamnose 3,5-epimerase
MIAEETELEGCYILKPTVYNDERGYFVEFFNQNVLNKCLNRTITFVQDNESKSSKGVLRGLHFQKGEYAQAKLVRVIKGKVLDVVVDIRPSSKTFGKSFSIELSQENKLQLFIPRGFAHGFLALEDDTIFAYKCDNYYNKESESGIVFNDKDLAIDWKVDTNSLILSSKDHVLPDFKNIEL